MKKLFFIFFSLLILVGCGKSEENVLEKVEKKIKDAKNYQLNGILAISRGNDEYTYDVSCSYMSNDYFRVSLINKVNNHEQIILRNDTGVYVITPSLNKSFKFESDWPYNNSQVYLLQTILSDIKNDPDYSMTKDKDYYIFKSKVNYTNNNNLAYQKVYVDANYDIIMVEVYDNNDNVLITMNINDINYKANFDDNYFALNAEYTTKLDKTAKEINDVVYPMYIPANTYLTNQETITTSSGERVILTFDGDSSFMLVEETISIPSELETNMVYGEPDIILDTVGYITDYSVSWMSNGYEYYLVSNDMSNEEMMNVAASMSVMPVGK